MQEELISIAKHAGEIMLAADPSVTTAEAKANSSDLVTEVDKQIEDMVTDEACMEQLDKIGAGGTHNGDGHEHPHTCRHR